MRTPAAQFLRTLNVTTTDDFDNMTSETRSTFRAWFVQNHAPDCLEHIVKDSELVDTIMDIVRRYLRADDQLVQRALMHHIGKMIVCAIAYHADDAGRNDVIDSDTPEQQARDQHNKWMGV